MKFSFLLLIVTFIGCSGIKEGPTSIVQKAESCGAGELSTTSTAAIEDWFTKHRDCAGGVDTMCKPVSHFMGRLNRRARLYRRSQCRAMGAVAKQGPRDLPSRLEVTPVQLET